MQGAGPDTLQQVASVQTCSQRRDAVTLTLLPRLLQ
jgi:hypothetical protein